MALDCTCPHCERAVTITDDGSCSFELYIGKAEGRRTLRCLFLVCPNPDCQKIALTVTLYESVRADTGQENLGKKLEHWNLVPSSRAKTFPSYIPQAILDDYREACLIQDLSPKASATLSRQCLQNILRDFWSVKPGRLLDEIDQIKDKVDDRTWKAIDSVCKLDQIKDKVDDLTWKAVDSARKLGSIRARMKKDIAVIPDVEPEEAQLLIGLIERLLFDWYIARRKGKLRMSSVIASP